VRTFGLLARKHKGLEGMFALLTDVLVHRHGKLSTESLLLLIISHDGA
jgi:hypothetical protein